MRDGHLEALERQAHALGGVLDDAQVRLMRDDELHVVDGQVRAAQHLLDGGGHDAGGELEHLLAVHVQGLARRPCGYAFRDVELDVDGGGAGVGLLQRVRIDALGRERLGRVVGGRAGEGIGIVVIVFDVPRQDAGLALVPFHHGGAGAVAEQHARVAVVPVDDAGQALAAHHERASDGVAARSARSVRGAGGHHGLGDGQAVDEARARGVHVECGGVDKAQAAAQHGGAGGDHFVRRDGGVDDKVDVLGSDLALGIAAVRPAQRLARGAFGQVNVALADAHAAREDARARGNPFVAGVHQLGQLFIGHVKCRQLLAAADDGATHDAPSIYGAMRPGDDACRLHSSIASQIAAPANPHVMAPARTGIGAQVK